MATSSETHPTHSLPADLRTALGWGARVALLALMTWTGSAIGHPYGRVVDLAIGICLGLALLGLGSLGLGLLRWVAIDWARVLGRAAVHATIGAAALLARTFELALVFDQVPVGVLALRSLRLGPR